MLVKDRCTECGHKLRGGMVFEGFMANLFVEAVRKSDGMGKVLASSFQHNGSQYSRLAGLRHWGLLEQTSDDWHYGVYRLTKLAYDFLAGNVTIPRSVSISNRKVVDLSEERVDLKTAVGTKWNTIEQYISDWRRG